MVARQDCLYLWMILQQISKEEREAIREPPHAKKMISRKLKRVCSMVKRQERRSRSYLIIQIQGVRITKNKELYQDPGMQILRHIKNQVVLRITGAAGIL